VVKFGSASSHTRQLPQKPGDTKMGSGKGNPEFFVAKVKPGTVMFEMDGVSEEIAREAMRLASHKLAG
jgi:large subunit ribosomal protein L16